MSENQYIHPNQPDVLEVINNLSSDQVATPPRVVNAVLDLLPENVWTNPNLRWLDPGSKTGVFPREIAKRLMIGLEDEIEDEAERLQHILANMVFAIAITDTAAMMTRRSLYCSKDASSDFAATLFSTSAGNVWYERVEHSFDKKGRCTECRGTKEQLEKPNRDNFAYGFIHEGGRKQITQEVNMKFDVIVGNPPYHMRGGGGGTNDTPIYDVFVEEAIKLNPNYIAMIIPSRWTAGGRGLEKFRAAMLGDKRVRHLVDYPDAFDLFPGVDIEGGVCYFLWDSDNNGVCTGTTRRGDVSVGPVERALDEYDIFVRDMRALPILKKVLKKKEVSLADIVSGDTPFGLPSNFRGYRKGDKKQSNDLKVFMNEGGSRVEHWVDRDVVMKNTHLARAWKVLVPEAYGERGAIPARVLGPTMIASPNTVCTQTFLVIGTVKSKSEAESLTSYIATRLVRFLVSLRKITQHAGKFTYTWVPQQTWDRRWTDAELYKKYGITKEEQEYIESMVKEMPA